MQGTPPPHEDFRSALFPKRDNRGIFQEVADVEPMSPALQDLIDKVAEAMISEKKVRADRAKELLEQFKK